MNKDGRVIFPRTMRIGDRSMQTQNERDRIDARLATLAKDEYELLRVALAS